MIPRLSFAAICTIALAFFVATAFASPWNSRNNPQILSSSYNYKFSSLPTSGRLSRLPWSDSYWPSFQGGIAYRWNSNSPQNFRYTLYSLSRLRRASQSTLRSLSPAEKYDIYMGRYDYPTVKSEWSRTSPDDEDWEGLCHGWAPASFFFTEPRPITLTNPDGINVPFGSSDIKALLTYFVAEYSSSTRNKRFVGDRCKYDLDSNEDAADTAACSDINAGSFHVIIANQIGIMKQGFLGDRDRGIEVWNQPIMGYDTSVTRTRSTSRGTDVTVSTRMYYGQETSPRWDAHDPRIVYETFRYTLNLDRNGNIVGGDHITFNRPDFFYNAELGSFTGYFSSLQTIYQRSVGISSPRTPAVAMASPSVAEPSPLVLNATVLAERTGSFGTGESPYPNNHVASWSIQSPGSNSIVISFTSFATERHRDTVKIYEGSNGDGALVAVLHGHELPNDVVVRGDGALIVFESDDSTPDDGFEATYEAL